MKVTLVESNGRWKHHISGETAINFHQAIEDADAEAVKINTIALLEKCKEFFDPEEQEYVIFEIEDLIDSMNSVDAEDEDEIDFILDEVYDFCDGYGIFIDLDVEEEPAPETEPEEAELPPVEVEAEPIEEVPAEETEGE